MQHLTVLSKCTLGGQRQYGKVTNREREREFIGVNIKQFHTN